MRIPSDAINERSGYILIIFASIILFYFIFFLGINIHYYSADDFRYAFGGLNKSCAGDDGFYFMQTLGRPFQAYMDCLNYKLGYTPENMVWVRFISICLMGCIAGLLADLFLSLGIPLVTSFFVGGSFLLLHQLYGAAILMAANSILFPLLFVLLAHKFIGQNRYLISFCFMLSALLTYPAMAFFFVVLLLAEILFSPLNNWNILRNKLIKSVFLFCFSCLIYFVLAYLNMHFNKQAPVPDAYQLDHPNFNLIEATRRLFYLANFFHNMWAFFPYGNLKWQAWFMIALLSGACGIGLLNFFTSSSFIQNKKNSLLVLGQVICSVGMLLILSNFFLLVIPSFKFAIEAGEPWLLYSTLSAGIVLLLWSVNKWGALLPIPYQQKFTLLIVGVFFLMAANQANVFISSKALGYNQYQNLTKNRINSFLNTNKELKRVHFIVPKNLYPYNTYFLTNAALLEILGRNKYEVKWCSLPRGVLGSEQAHQEELIECLNTLTKNGIGVSYSFPDETFHKTNSMMIIDLQKDGNKEDYYSQSLNQYFGKLG